MSREIKFRGKRFDTGEWVYGLLFKYSYRNEILTYISYDDYAFKNGSIYGWDVDSKTVGQYTGLNDKVNEEIYEGDIVDEKFRMIVTFEDAAFYVANQYTKAYLLDDYIKKRKVAKCDIKVVGNIYENPKLLNSH